MIDLTKASVLNFEKLLPQTETITSFCEKNVNAKIDLLSIILIVMRMYFGKKKL